VIGKDEIVGVLERSLAAAAGDEADAIVVASERNVTRFANSNVHQNMSEESGELVLRIIADGKQGVASTSSFLDEDIRHTASLALDMARRSERLEGFTGLYGGNEPVAELPTFDEATSRLADADKAHRLRAMFDEGTTKKVTFAGSFSTTVASLAAGNTNGIRRWAPLTAADLVTIAVADDTSGFATRMSRRSGDIDTMELGREATDAALLRRHDRSDIDAGPWDVILGPPAMAEIFEWMNMITFTGQSYEDGSSFFVGNRDKQVLGVNCTLADDPLDPEFAPFPFDAEGMPRRRNSLVEKGRVHGPVLDRLMADRLGLEPTANAASPGSDEHGIALHVSMAGGSASREEIIATTERGILVTRFHYLNGLIEPRTAMMTGMTRDGTFLIEDGKVTKRLPNLRWTQSMVEAFSNIDTLSKERRIIGTWWNTFGGTLAPTVKIRGWKITGRSGA